MILAIYPARIPVGCFQFRLHVPHLSQDSPDPMKPGKNIYCLNSLFTSTEEGGHGLFACYFCLHDTKNRFEDILRKLFEMGPTFAVTAIMEILCSEQVIIST